MIGMAEIARHSVCRRSLPAIIITFTINVLASATGRNRMANAKLKMGYSEYAEIPDDGKQHEIIDGEHYMNPAPNTYHQTVSRLIQFQLMQQVEMQKLGVVYDAPTDVQLSDHDIIQPDLVVVLAENRNIITPIKIKGVPDLVVEILSPSTKKKDIELKHQLYCRSGIPEYWIVDPDEHLIQQFALVGAEYRLLGSESTAISPRIIEGVTVDLTAVW